MLSNCTKFEKADIYDIYKIYFKVNKNDYLSFIKSPN